MGLTNLPFFGLLFCLPLTGLSVILGFKGICFSCNIFFRAARGTTLSPNVLYSNPSFTLKEAKEILIRDRISLGLNACF